MKIGFSLLCLWGFLFTSNMTFAEVSSDFQNISTKDQQNSREPDSHLDQRINRLEESMKTLEDKMEETVQIFESRFEEMMKALETKLGHNQEQSAQKQEVRVAAENVQDQMSSGVKTLAINPEETEDISSLDEREVGAAEGRVDKKIQSLEESIKDLQNRNTIMDMTEEVRRVQEYVCKNGHVFSTGAEDKKCPTCGLKQKARDQFKLFKFARRESVSERIEAAIDEAFEKRVLIGASGTGILQQILSSEKEEKGFASGSFDLLFITKPLLYTTFFIDLEAIGGNGPDELLGSFSGLNDDSGSLQDDDGVDRVSVREVWLQSYLFDQKLRLVGGKIDLTNYFDHNAIANDETTQFITGAFVNNPTLEVPDNGPGLVVFFDTMKGPNFGFGLQSADNSGTNITDDIYAIAQIGYRSYGFFGREGNWRIWGRINGEKDDNKGFGVSMDQNLTTRLTAFARYGANEEEEENAAIASAWSLGLRYRSPFFSRVNDEIALAFGRLDIVDGGEESVAELYYKFQFNKHTSITPNIQTLIDPAGVDSEGTSVLAGIRTQIEF
ncbi:MAG: hypothetical protein CV087_13565 [Candidatus Brocadia sp. WS118]|nr:MAG: hypothetical protein CV087_13565 [Candidatus Brocadia sp. WS118]